MKYTNQVYRKAYLQFFEVPMTVPNLHYLLIFLLHFVKIGFDWGLSGSVLGAFFINADAGAAFRKVHVVLDRES